MKRRFFLVMMAIVGICTATFGFEGNDDNVTRDYYVQLYKTQSYVPDFNQSFALETDRRDYKKLREYLNNKEEILRLLKMAGDEYYYGLSYSKLFAVDYLQSLEDELKTRNQDDVILLRLNSVRPYFDFSGEYMVSYVESNILPILKARYREAESRDSINQITYMQIQKNADAIRQDIFQAEQAIYDALSPEFRNQDFKIWISLTFSGLIAVLLLAFFLIIFKRSDLSLSKHLLSSSGLQFITVFILIIAIVLFGILGVLGGSELAAILSGISGYILGKGGNGAVETIQKGTAEKGKNANKTQQLSAGIAEKESPVIFIENERDNKEPVNPSDNANQDETTEDDKFFPGGKYQ